MDDSADRLIPLETKLAYMEDFIERLQTIVVEHTANIDRLTAENRALRSKITDVEESIQERPDQRPPHY